MRRVQRAPTWANATSSASDDCSTCAVSIAVRAMSCFSSYAAPGVTFLFTTKVQWSFAGMGYTAYAPIGIIELPRISCASVNNVIGVPPGAQGLPLAGLSLLETGL